MATYVPAKRAVEYIFYVSLVQQADTKLLQSNPTLASGDVTISKDGGAFANLTTLPTVTPASGKSVKVTVSNTEMTADNVLIVFSDAAGAQWCDLSINIQTAARQIDDLAYPATSGRSMVVDAAGLVDANTVKVGPTGSGTAQTAGDIIGDTNDIQARLPAALVSGRIDASVGAMATDVVTAAALAADAGSEIGTAVWASTSAISGKTYGLLLAEINAAQILRVGQFQSGSTTQAIVLDSGASAVDDFYNRTTITIVTGASAAQNRLINDYDGSTKTAYLDRPLLVGAPASGAWFAIDSRGNTRSASDLRIGLAQGGGASTITLQATESASNDFFNRMFILIESGTGEGQARLIDDYDGATKVATVARPWVIQPDNTSRYVILPFGSVKVSDIDSDAVNASALAADAVAEIADGVWDELISGHLGAGSTGAALNAAGAAGDPWSTAIPGAYGAGTAGFILGNNVDAAVSTRLPTASYTAPDNATIATIQSDTNDIQSKIGTPVATLATDISTVDTVVDAIKGKTDSLTFTVANKVDANTKSVNDVTIVGDGSGTPFNV